MVLLLQCQISTMLNFSLSEQKKGLSISRQPRISKYTNKRFLCLKIGATEKIIINRQTTFRSVNKDMSYRVGTSQNASPHLPLKELLSCNLPLSISYTLSHSISISSRLWLASSMTFPSCFKFKSISLTS